VPWRGRSMGAVAIAADDGGTWSLQPPLLRAQGISHEIERPHVLVQGSRYYLFFSAQRHSFHPPQAAPTGLYGFVARDLSGPWEPLNGSGLVIRNPPRAPDQAYAWLVLPDLRAVSFLNYRSPAGGDLRRAPAEDARAGFGGTLAPTLQLALDGSVTSIVVSNNREETPT
jgi:levansucrase